MQNSVANRIKVTKRGTILRRAMGQSHFMSKKRSVQLNRKKRLRTLGDGAKIVRKYLG